ncbi:hypothetical protein N0V88_005629 [Collariella sp. IMI 366227]|nr:hypothetical protein N0V88_005629 [Collariella sp. IMI 366227]
MTKSHFSATTYHLLPPSQKWLPHLEIRDITERDIDDVAPPSFPTAPAPSTTGFPAHKKRVSAFKQQRQGKSSAATSSNKPSASSLSKNGASQGGKIDERRGIDDENKAVLDSMSPDEIAEAQRELVNGLEPKFLQMLLRRANLDEQFGPSPFDDPSTEIPTAANGPPVPAPKQRQVTVEDEPEELSSTAAPTPPPKQQPAKPKKKDSLPVSALRFDFRGALLPPRLSRAVPVTKGLHHHGEAPEAAGYTIPELARLARSAVPAQRCLAYQTLGRMLGGEEDDLAFALWRCLRRRVLESLEEEAGLPEEGAYEL